MSQLKTIEVSDISLELLDASVRNPRRTMNEEDLRELAASIREFGIQVPLLVRPTLRNVIVELDNGDCYDIPGLRREDASPYITGSAFPGRKVVRCEVEDQYEIVCGHRRSEAATIAGLTSVPCIVRELDDVMAAEIALIDNLQRVDVPPLEEAEAFGELLERLLTIPAVAAKVGKEQSYVAKRLKLLSLTTWSREALREKLITIDHAMLLARVAEAEQNEALKWCLDPQAGKKTPVYDIVKDRVKRKNPSAAKAAAAIDGESDEDVDGDDDPDFDDEPDETGRRAVWNRAWECESVQRLKEHIESSSGEVLDRAPWPMEEDWLVADAGSCLDCPKNTKANTPLFGDLDMGVAVCTDGACFKAKTEAFVQIQSGDAAKAAAAKAQIPGKGPGDFEILRASWKATSTVPRQLKDGGGANPAQLFKSGQWIEAKKTCEQARAAVTVDWDDANSLRKPGEIIQVCIEPLCKVHPKSWEEAAKGKGNSRTEVRETDEQRKAREERMKIAAKEETRVRIQLASEAIRKIAKFPDVLLRSMLVEMLPNGSERKALEAVCPNVELLLKTAKLDSLEFGRAVAAASLTGRYLEVWESWEPKQFRKEFISELGRLGFDATKAWDKPKAAKVAPKKAAAKKAAKKGSAK